MLCLASFSRDFVFRASLECIRGHLLCGRIDEHEESVAGPTSRAPEGAACVVSMLRSSSGIALRPRGERGVRCGAVGEWRRFTATRW